MLNNPNEILHTSRQLHYRDVSKISLRSVECVSNQSTANFGRNSNSIEISLVGIRYAAANSASIIHPRFPRAIFAAGERNEN